MIVIKILKNLHLIVFELYQVIKFYILFSKKFKNKDCFVLGSAPHGNLNSFNKGMLLITSSGSAKLAEILGYNNADLSLLDCEILTGDQDTRTIITDNNLLKNINLGILVQTQSNYHKFGNPKVLGANYSHYFEISLVARKIITFLVTKNMTIENKSDFKISSGIFSVIICFFLGARSVHLSGFSLFQYNMKTDIPEHFYKKYLNLEISSYDNSNNLYKFRLPRNHSAADIFVLSNLHIKGKKIFTSDLDLLPIIKNWSKK